MSLDAQILKLLRHGAGQGDPLDRLLLAIARHGSRGEVLLMLLSGLVAGRRGAAVVARCLIAVGVLYLLVDGIGRLIRRERPFAADPRVQPLLEHAADRSFPSRHVASATAMAIVVRPAAPRVAVMMGVLAGLLALGRVRAGIHYPSDVVAGAGLGWLVGVLVGGGRGGSRRRTSRR